MNKLNQNVTNGKRTSEVFRIPKWIENFASLNKKKALIRLFILLAITLFFGAQIPKLKFNYDFDSFFPRGDDNLTYYESLNDEFGEFNDFLFVVLKHKKPTDTVALKVAHKTIKDLKLWPDISGIQSPFETKKFQVTPFGINSIRLISPQKVVSIVQKYICQTICGNTSILARQMHKRVKHEATQPQKSSCMPRLAISK